MRLNFAKYSGNGNDFIIIEGPLKLLPKLVRNMCDRHFGIGADGVLVLSPEEGYDGRMQIFNADGGEAEMCGNGLRCLVTYMDDQRINKKSSYSIKTMNGSYEVCRRNESFAIEMSEIKEKNLYDLSILKGFKNAFFVNTGVPHLVFEVDNVKKIHIQSLAPHYRSHKLFPNGTNVSFLQILSGHHLAYVRTFERGVEDETFSCGTGLTACGLALNHWYGWQGAIDLETKGGLQNVEVGEKIFYSGEVKFCFTGEYRL